MVGASKLSAIDVIHIRRLIERGESDDIIASKYNVSRVLITNIRNGKRWNEKEKSFFMKEDVMNYTRTITIMNNKRYSTGISPIFTINGEAFVLVHYIDDVEIMVDNTIYKNKPEYDELILKHKNFIKNN